MRSDGGVHRIAVSFLCSLVLVSGCSSGDSAAPATTTAATAGDATSTSSPAGGCAAAPTDQLDISYVEGGDPLQALDLYLPDDAGCDPVPVVVWVHGGGWRTGDKRHAVADKVPLWNDAGWAVVSVGYRLSDAAVPEAERVMAPAHNEDVAAAVGWLHEHAAELGIDADNMALVGHSAGAGIIAALAADPAYLQAVDLEPRDIPCVAPLDTEAFEIAAAASNQLLAGIYESAFGTDPEQWAELSPLTHLGEAPLPDLFLVTRGLPERRRIVQQFADAAAAVGGNVTVVDLPGFTHEDVNKQIGARSDSVLTPALQEFLTGCLG